MSSYNMSSRQNRRHTLFSSVACAQQHSHPDRNRLRWLTVEKEFRVLSTVVIMSIRPDDDRIVPLLSRADGRAARS
jgi:hypothetical protein